MPKKLKELRLLFNLLNENKKFLLVIDSNTLRGLERRSGIYLGTQKPNKIRPAICYKVESSSNKYFMLHLLTSSNFTGFSINLNHCPERQTKCGTILHFYERSFHFKHPQLGFVVFKIKDPELLGNVHFCGFCEDLESLQNLKPLKEF